MTHTIRPYRHSDFSMIVSWWNAAGQCPPIEGMMSPAGSFVLELNGEPALSLSLLLTQSKEISFIEGFIKNPAFKQSLEEYGTVLWQHCFSVAEELGYKRVVCYCLEDKLINKYKRFGMEQTASGLSSFVRVL